MNTEKQHHQLNNSVVIPHQWRWFFATFRRYSVRYIRKHFHALRLSNGSAILPDAQEPILVVMNHPAWWDPLVAFVLSREWPQCDHYGAIDAATIKQYEIFTRLGFVGVDTTRFQGAAHFLRVGGAILSKPSRLFWVTAQGHFADVRSRPLRLKSGVGHLAARMSMGCVLPLAVEYVFWNERTPEILVRFGEPIRVAAHREWTGKQWIHQIETALESTLNELNREAITRDPLRFRTLVSGRVGIGGIYDLWRRLKSAVQGKRANLAHESTSNPKAN